MRSALFTQSAKFDAKLTVRSIVLSALLGALLFVSQVALSFAANIELVSLLVVIYTLELRREMPYAILVFIVLEGLFYGFGIWWVMYLYVWYMLAGVTWLLRKNGSSIIWACVLAAFGFAFGAMCAIPYVFIEMPSFALSWWISGIPYDLVHGAANFVLALLLLKPLRLAVSRIKEKIKY